MSRTRLSDKRVLSAVIGSYPKPDYLFAGTGRELLDEMGMSFKQLEVEVGLDECRARIRRATLQAISDQNEAGIDLVSDGEEPRDHYVLYVLRGLDGIDFDVLEEREIRDGRYTRQVPVVREPLGYRGPILVDDYRFLASHTRQIAKVNLPGPSTAVDCVADRVYGGDPARLAWAYAEAIRHEVGALIEAGCKVIQFDDPVLLRHPERAKEWGLETLQACFRGYEDAACFGVHICRGYPDGSLEDQGVEYKANADYYADVLDWFSDSTLDIISIEGAECNLDLSVLPAAKELTVMLGVLDVGSDQVEEVETLVHRGREALDRLPACQLILAPDCGMLQLSREVAKAKLANLAEAVAILNSDEERSA
jgi:5-methyltetrahydropteroyltriglutamate--homocysteine methyltransferase